MHGSKQQSISYGRIYEEPETQFSVECGYGNDCELFRQVVGIRAAHPVGPYEYDFDSYSEHYLIRHRDRPIGAMTATRLVAGDLDCAEFYPKHLMLDHGHELFSTCKFRMLRCEGSPLRAVRVIGGAMWEHQLSLGSRLLVINSAKDLLPFYLRMGFRIVEGSRFIHPTLGTDSLVLVQAPDPNWRSFYQDIFARFKNPLRWDELGRPQMQPESLASSISTLTSS